MRRNIKKKVLSNKGLNLTLVDQVMLLGTVAILLVGIIMFAFGMKTSKENQVKMVEDALDTLAMNHKSQMETFIEDNMENLELLATFPQVYEMDQKEQKAFLKGRGPKAGFKHIFVVDMKGQGYYFDEGVVRDQSGEQFFQWLIENGSYVTPPFYWEDEVISTLCVPIYDKDRKQVGFLCGALDLTQIRDVFSNTQIILGGEWFIINDQGDYMAHQDMDKVIRQESLFGEKNSEFSLIQKSMIDKQDREGTITLQGDTWLTRIVYMKDYQWLLVVGCREDAILEDLHRLDILRVIHATGSLLLFVLLIRLVYCWKKSDKKNYTDVLTKCNSRASFERVLEKLEGNPRYRISVIYMDLNGFKEVNDTFGHEQGDRVLIAFAKSLTGVFKKQGFVARLGGDEFVCIMLDAKEEEIDHLLTQVHESLKTRIRKEGLPAFVTTAYGVAHREKNCLGSLSDVTTEADRRMYENKGEIRRAQSREMREIPVETEVSKETTEEGNIKE